jgi:triacylglycerol lipase
LDQWGLERRPGEGTAAYASRLEANSAWYLGMDSSWYDLRPSGAAEFNGRVGAQSDVYYFSWAASATHESAGRQLPNVSMNPLLALNAVAMGRYRGIDGPWILDQSWEENDGTVNRISMDGPKLGSMDRILPFSGRPLRGIWNYMGCLAETDHVDLLGLATPPWYSPPGFASSEDWYRYNMLLLASLEDGP